MAQQQSDLIVRSVERQGRREFSASVARGQVNGPHTRPKILRLTQLKGGKVRDQYGHEYDWEKFEPFLKS